MKLSTILALTGSLYSSFVYAGAFMDTEAAVCNVKNSTDGTLTPIAVSEVKAGMAIPSDTTGLSLRCSYGGSSVDEFENWFSSELATGSQAVERSALAEEKRAECGCVGGRRCCILCDLDWTSGYVNCYKACVTDKFCPT
ncbi:hypothetical protein GLAREA_11099 [Glarea lozoyensis ATCC 20868]|uniref:Ig-like domain-containing protein n=1 Tax=Glarea lozoyensis (strain ATCC 20868 / MF5171) TaxID=1116229 RepID=S3DCF6_GLAL2|nr:uncharacterized protein GLAREA_11099 [Glarea lozoyensis ATCC 20868]EPE35400.1 hypothetical protein GLAREA_11099 [Glarea lozoyensis ATCC 20868]